MTVGSKKEMKAQVITYLRAQIDYTRINLLEVEQDGNAILILFVELFNIVHHVLLIIRGEHTAGQGIGTFQ